MSHGPDRPAQHPDPRDDGVPRGLGLQVAVALFKLVLIVGAVAYSCVPGPSPRHMPLDGVADGWIAQQPCALGEGAGLGPGIPDTSASTRATCSYDQVAGAPGVHAVLTIAVHPGGMPSGTTTLGRHRAYLGATAGSLDQNDHVNVTLRLTAAPGTRDTAAVVRRTLGRIERHLPTPGP